MVFDRYAEALAFTRQILRQLVADEASAAGAEDAVIEMEETEVIPGAMLQLTAWAMGKPGLT
jgi:hypothetical protein